MHTDPGRFQVRDTPECAAAAAEEDARATAILAAGAGNPKVHAAVFLATYEGSKKAAERCFTKALEAAGAQAVMTQLGGGATTGPLLQQGTGGDGVCGVFVCQFSCRCAEHSAHCGADVLHRTHKTLSCPADSDNCDDVQLLYATMIPSGNKFTFAQLCTQNLSYLLPLSAPAGGPEVATHALSKVIHGDLSSVITIIVTTSPMRCDPDTDILETTFASLSLAGLQACRKILVCDSLNVDSTPVSPGTKFKGFKKGYLRPEYLERYRQRLAMMREATWAREMKVELLELETWHGFALATLRALELVHTPLVCVIQHDLAFLRRVNLAPVADILLRRQVREVEQEESF